MSMSVQHLHQQPLQREPLLSQPHRLTYDGKYVDLTPRRSKCCTLGPYYDDQTDNYAFSSESIVK